MVAQALSNYGRIFCWYQHEAPLAASVVMNQVVCDKFVALNLDKALCHGFVVRHTALSSFCVTNLWQVC